MSNRVERKKTPISESEFKNSLTKTWIDLYGHAPSEEQLALILAQNNLETNNRNSMYNYNIGNITTNGNHPFFDDLQTSEQVKPGKWVKMNLKYKAYNSLDEGVKDYILFLSKNPRYAKAWEHIMNPNPKLFGMELGNAGYYTADKDKYTKALEQRYNQAIGLDNSKDKINNEGWISENEINQVLENVLKLIESNNKINFTNTSPTYNTDLIKQKNKVIKLANYVDYYLNNIKTF